MPNQDPTQNPQNTNTTPALPVVPNDQQPDISDSMSMHTDLPPLPPDFQQSAASNSGAPSALPDKDLAQAGSSDLPPMVTSTPKKKFGTGKIIATILGIFLLVGGIASGILLTQQNQNVQEKASDNLPPLDWNDCEGGRCTNDGACIWDVCDSAADAEACSRGGDCHTNCTPSRDTECDSGGSNECPSGEFPSCVPSESGNHRTCRCCPPGQRLQPNGVAWITTTRPEVQVPGESVNPCGDGNTRTGRGRDISFVACNYKNCDDGYWIIEVECNMNICQGLGTPAPTPTPGPTAQCQNIKAYSEDWVLLTNAQLALLGPTDKVNFCVAGTASEGTFDMAKFTINSVVQAETTTVRPTTTDFCQLYTIPAATTTFNVTAEIHHAALGWK